MSNDSNLIALEEPAPVASEPSGTLRSYLNGPAGLGLIALLYLIVGGSAWLIGETRASEHNAPMVASPQPVPEPTLIPEPTAVAVPTMLPAPVVQAAPTVIIRPQPTKVSYAVEPPPQGKFILIDQDRQTMFIFEDGREVDRYFISSGIPGSRLTDTPRWTGQVSHYVGTFFSYGGFADSAWYLFKDYVGDILIHSAPYTLVDGKKVYQDTDKLGQAPSSHGCIRMDPQAIERLGLWGPKGALVHITPWTGNGPARLPGTGASPS
ncbi:MAG: hypothetical protein CL878_11565 [Dehalococcoidia bacterium]|nr:hypothetical protein [Dehalococcoidia bacterium]